MIALFLLTAALTVSVSPRIAFAPATVRARVSLDAGAAARRLLVALESADFSQTTELPVPGPGRHTYWIAPWVRVPAGDYVVTAAIVDASGAITARQSTTVHIEPGVSQ